MEKVKKKIEFTEEVDDSINGYATAITFIIVGIFLLNNLEYFGNRIAAIIILSFFTFFRSNWDVYRIK